MGRIVAIAGGDLQSTFPINRFIVHMDKKNNHNLLFVGTACEDAEGYINNSNFPHPKLIKTLSFPGFGCKNMCTLTTKVT